MPTPALDRECFSHTDFTLPDGRCGSFQIVRVGRISGRVRIVFDFLPDVRIHRREAVKKDESSLTPAPTAGA